MPPARHLPALTRNHHSHAPTAICMYMMLYGCIEQITRTCATSWAVCLSGPRTSPSGPGPRSALPYVYIHIASRAASNRPPLPERPLLLCLSGPRTSPSGLDRESPLPSACGWRAGSRGSAASSWRGLPTHTGRRHRSHNQDERATPDSMKVLKVRDHPLCLCLLMSSE